jgi:HD-GYP domain-containing protein (c-di-GMP phosphodiesterase class II)
VSLSEPLAALSVASDLARGRPPEEAARACLAATALAGALGLSAGEKETVFWTALLRSVGCTATSHEYAVYLGGDDVRVRRRADAADLAAPREAFAFFGSLTQGPLPVRVARGAALATRAKTVARDGARADCEVAAQMAGRFGLGESVATSLRDVFERWDGKGFPSARHAEEIALAARVAAVAHALVAADDPPTTLARWAGRALDPDIAAHALRDLDALRSAAAAGDPVAAVVAAEPSRERADGGRLDDIALAFADAADLKAPFLHGHSRAVAALAEAAGRRLGLGDDVLTDLRRAGLLHDLGRVAVSSGIWEKPGPLTPLEWEAVRLHAYHGERILARSRVLGPLAPLVGSHHERLDGSGYHRGVRGNELDLPSRLLAAADVYDALTTDRPHRPRLADVEAARLLTSMPLDQDAVASVLEAAGRPAPRRRTYPVGLTQREVAVLRLLVRGLSKKQIASALVVSPSTVHTHVVHIYEKAGVSTRAAAVMFALEHGLLEPAAKID